LKIIQSPTEPESASNLFELQYKGESASDLFEQWKDEELIFE